MLHKYHLVKVSAVFPGSNRAVRHVQKQRQGEQVGQRRRHTRKKHAPQSFPKADEAEQEGNEKVERNVPHLDAA